MKNDKLKRDKTGRIIFTKKMKKEYTLLFPMMAPIHFAMLQKVFNMDIMQSCLLIPALKSHRPV